MQKSSGKGCLWCTQCESALSALTLLLVSVTLKIDYLRHCQEILLVLDGNTGLNMLPQAREFNEVFII